MPVHCSCTWSKEPEVILVTDRTPFLRSGVFVNKDELNRTRAARVRMMSLERQDSFRLNNAARPDEVVRD